MLDPFPAGRRSATRFGSGGFEDGAGGGVSVFRFFIFYSAARALRGDFPKLSVSKSSEKTFSTQCKRIGLRVPQAWLFGHKTISILRIRRLLDKPSFGTVAVHFTESPSGIVHLRTSSCGGQTSQGVQSELVRELKISFRKLINDTLEIWWSHRQVCLRLTWREWFSECRYSMPSTNSNDDDTDATWRPLHVAIVGSTGSIGKSAIDVIIASSGRFVPFLLAAHRNTSKLIEQARACKPAWVVVVDPIAAAAEDWSGLPSDTKLAVGSDALDQLVGDPRVDRVLAAIVGSAGLRSTWSALEAGKVVALANKETLVMAGPLVMELAARSGSRIIPVDSEHSAIYQAMQAGHPNEVRKIILTASGGPFRKHSAEALTLVTVAEALRHPTWSMGPKITIDSATMMNKALELIEARWLFGVDANCLDVVIHPQSIVHSLVEFIDGSVVAQMGPPDMRLPIQYALTCPHRMECPARRLDFSGPLTLEFEPPDLGRFPAVRLGLEAARAGGTAGAVLNAANEAAVGRFLEGRMLFTDIAKVCERVLGEHRYKSSPSLDELMHVDTVARQEIEKWN